MTKNIIFDMGNVLLDYNPRYSLERYLDREEDRALLFRELFQGPEWAAGDRGEIRDLDRYELVAPRVPQRLRPALKTIVKRWHDCMVPLPGARAFVRACREASYGIYVLSNASDAFYHYFPNFCPLEDLDGYLVSCDAHLCKPDPHIYRMLTDRYHLIPEQCLFIDDMPQNVAGAQQAGLQAVRFQGDFAPLERLLGLRG